MTHNLPLSITSERGLQALQVVTRAVLAVLAIYYFLGVPAFFFPLPGWFIWVLLAGYVTGHVVLLLIQSKPSSLPLGAGIDLIALGILLGLDPGTPPPTLALFIVAVLSSGVLHGLKRFLITLTGAIVILLAALGARQLYATEPLAADTIFLLSSLAICVLYFSLLLLRNNLLAQKATEATWQDPDTGLISREALTHTAGWLLPLHDRLSNQLTVALVQTDSEDNLYKLNEIVIQRLRRSDVAARYDDKTIAVLLSCAEREIADAVLEDLYNKQPEIRVASMTLSNPDIALEAVLHRLDQTLERARKNQERWLVHATGL